MDRSTLEQKPVKDLRAIASSLGVEGTSGLRKAQLVDAILGQAEEADGDGGGGQDTASRRRADADALIERRRQRSRGRDDDGGDDDDESDGESDGDDGDGDNGADDDQRGGRRRRGRGRDDDGPRDQEQREGVLDLLPEGYGFLRTTGYLAGDLDVYVSQSYVRRFKLRRGDMLGGPVKYNKGNDRYPALSRLETHEGRTVVNENDQVLRDRPSFDDLAAVFPTRRLLVDATEPAVQLFDLVAPQGYGQRTVVTAPRGAGGSALLTALARAAEAADGALEVMLVLVDARPEEVTWLQRTTTADVVASALGRPAEDHVAMIELAAERARRRAELGADVLLLVDSLTDVGRAYAAASGGRNQPVGPDPATLAQAKSLLGTGRDLEDAGSVTVVGLTRSETGAAIDEALAVELQGVATSQVTLIPGAVTPDGVPGFDVAGSGTLREDLLVPEGERAELEALRARVAAADPAEAVALLDE